MAFLAEKRDELFDAGAAPPHRFLGKWERADALKNPIVRAAVVYFPWSCLFEGEAVRKRVAWLPVAPEKQMTEVSIFLVDGQPPRMTGQARTRWGQSSLASCPWSTGHRTDRVSGGLHVGGRRAKAGGPALLHGLIRSRPGPRQSHGHLGRCRRRAIMFLECPLTVQRK